MSHDAYICYDEKDIEYSDALCNILKDNNIKPWVKSRDFSSGDPVDKITNAIADSKCFILILSKHSNKTNYVITETDIAFSRDVPIIVFNIDEAKVDGNLEFILGNQKKIASYPYPKKQLKALVKETSRHMDKPVDKPKVNSKYAKIFEDTNPTIKSDTIKKAITLAIPIAIVLVLIYFFVIVPTGQHTTEDGIFSMNVTDVNVGGSAGNYEYKIYGESYNLPADSAKYFMNIKFFDKDNKMVYEVNSTADEFKSGVICTANIPENNVTHIGFKLTDINNKVLSKQNYTIEK